MNLKNVFAMLSRYFVLLLILFLNIKFDLIYEILTPLTVYPVYFVLHKLYFAQLIPSYYSCVESGAPAIFVKGYYACIVDACVAGSAYMLLLILNFSTPMHIVKRLKSLVFLISSFLLLNVIRIYVFIILVSIGYEYFDAVHKFTWIFASTILVVLVWFVNVWIFKIKTIPGYTDIKLICQDICNKPKRVHNVRANN